MWERRAAARLDAQRGNSAMVEEEGWSLKMLKITSHKSSAGSLATNTHRTDFFLVSFWPGEQDILATSRNMTPFI